MILINNAGLATSNQDKDIADTRKRLNEARQKLKNMQNNVLYQQKHRKKKRKSDFLREELDCIPAKRARTRKEEEQPGLLEAIKSIAIFGSAAHERRQTEEIKNCTSLNKLRASLSEMGYDIARSTLYTRLLPRNSSSLEGKRHVVTVPVKLCKAQNDLHKSHVDTKFCTSSIRNVEALASFLGPNQTGTLSQDDKYRINLGVTAAQKQSPILMHVQFRVKLPDHDWVVAEKHKLIPSVYAGIIVKDNCLGSPEAVTYSGPTYVAIRSGKHSSSTAATHAQDFERLLELQEFDCILKYNNKIKPILIVFVDGGPDENPR